MPVALMLMKMFYFVSAKHAFILFLKCTGVALIVVNVFEKKLRQN